MKKDLFVGKDFDNNAKYTEINYMLGEIKKGNFIFEENILMMFENLLIKKCKYYFGYVDEDILQMARIKLLELIRNFDIEKGVNFAGYVKIFINAFIWDLKKKEIRHKENMSTVVMDEAIANTLTYNETSFDNVLIVDAISTLDKKEQKLVEHHIIHSVPMSKLTQEFDMSIEQLKYLKKKTIAKLRKSL